MRFAPIFTHLLPVLFGVVAGDALMRSVTPLLSAATPGLSLVQPTDGSTIEGTVNIAAVASAAGLTTLQFSINGVPLGPDIGSGPCTASWDTTSVSDGNYVVSASGQADDGLTVSAAPVSVTVVNQSPQITGISVWNISSSGASVTWHTTQPTDAELEFGTASTYGQHTAIDGNPATTHTQVLTGLTSATSYHVRMLSRNAVGKLSASGDQVFTTASKPTPFGLPMPPVISNVQVSASATSAIVTWTTDLVSDSEIDFGPSPFFGQRAVTVELVPAHALTLPNLEPGKTYFGRIRSRTQSGATASATFKFTTPPQ